MMKQRAETPPLGPNLYQCRNTDCGVQVKEDATLAVDQMLRKQRKSLEEVEGELKAVLGDRTLKDLQESLQASSKVTPTNFLDC